MLEFIAKLMRLLSIQQIFACFIITSVFANIDSIEDVNHDGYNILQDAIIGLQALGGLTTDEPISGNLDGEETVGLAEIIYSLKQYSNQNCPDNAIFVSTTGLSSAAGTFTDPLDSLSSARDLIRFLKLNNILPSEGFTVCLRGGVYQARQPFELTGEDSGTATSPIVYKGYPGENVTISGGFELEPAWFIAVDDSDPVWSRLDESARSKILKIDLPSYGLFDYGELVERRFATYDTHSPMELSINQEMMQLARWPNQGETDNFNENDPVAVSGDLSPDVTGIYEFIGTAADGKADDDYPNYRRQGLVNGIQYYLYHCTYTWRETEVLYWYISEFDPRIDSNCWPKDEWAGEGSAWAVDHHDMESSSPPLLEPFHNSSGLAVVNDRPEDFKAHGFVLTPEVYSATSFRFPGDRYQRWEQADDIWVQGLLGEYWAADMISSKITGNTLNLATEPSFGLKNKMPFFVFNLLEEIDNPGEFYIDRKTGTLYLYPPQNFKEIRVSLLDEAIITGIGVEHVSFENMTLELSRGDLFYLRNSNNINLNNMTLRNSGATAITITGYNNRITNSKIYGSGATGIDINGGKRSDLIPGNNEVINCEIHDYGRWDRSYKAAIWVQGVGNKIVNNYIHDAPHMGIYFTGNNHLFEYNHIERVAMETGDAGAIYTGRDWGYRGNLIRYNYIRNIESIFGRSHGVYLDDGVSGITVFGNIFHSINGYGIKFGGGRDNIATNNIFVDARYGALTADRRVRETLNNKFVDDKPHSHNLLGRLNVNFNNYPEILEYQSGVWAQSYPKLAQIPNNYEQLIDEAHWQEPEGCVFAENISWKTEHLITDGSWGGYDAKDFFTRITPNLDNIDPLFIDEPGGNLNLHQNSPAFTMPDFVVIPFDRIGIIEQ